MKEHEIKEVKDIEAIVRIQCFVAGKENALAASGLSFSSGLYPLKQGDVYRVPLKTTISSFGETVKQLIALGAFAITATVMTRGMNDSLFF